MKFEIYFKDNEPQKHLEVYHSINVFYEDIYLFSQNGGGDCCLYIKDCNLEICFDSESKRFSGITGYIGKKEKIKYKPLSIPRKSKKGILYIESNEECISGVGYKYKIKDNLFYDYKNNILQVGIYNPYNIFYKVLKNVYVQLENNNLVGIIITNI